MYITVTCLSTLLKYFLLQVAEAPNSSFPFAAKDCFGKDSIFFNLSVSVFINLIAFCKQVPDVVNHRINLSTVKTKSILSYSENKTLNVGRIAENADVEIMAELATKLSWKKLRQRENFGIARLKGDFVMENGKQRLVSGLDQEESSGKARTSRHWGTVAPETLLDVLMKISLTGSIEHITGENGAEGKSIIHITNPSGGMIETSEMGTTIITDDETLASKIFQAIDGVLDGI